MKNTLTLLCLLSVINASGQFKKYAMLEHFTNTRCGICGSVNPNFFNTIKVETNKDVHHVSFHAAIPYNNCLFYLANTKEQDERGTFYSLQGTPSVSINGARLVTASSVTAASITAAATTGPLQIIVTESTTSPRTVKVEVKKNQTFDDAQNYRLYTAIVERKVSYSAPNGEKTHYNVFRKWLKAGGDTYNPLGPASQVFNYTYSNDPNWNSGETYILAFVQNTQTRDVVNSGTRFDATTPTEESLLSQAVSVFPNPTNGQLTFTFNGIEVEGLTIFNTTGQALESVRLNKNAQFTLNVSAYPSGIYLAKVQTTEGVALKTIFKQ